MLGACTIQTILDDVEPNEVDESCIIAVED